MSTVQEPRTSNAGNDADVEKSAGSNGDSASDEYLVRFDEQDPQDPKNFRHAYKLFILFQTALLSLVGSLGSAMMTPAATELQQDFNITLETTVLTVSLFVLGYAFGPLTWAPVSEIYGRKLSMVPAVFISGLFGIGTATSKSVASIFVTRFFTGFFVSAPISNASASLGDYFTPQQRGVPMAILSVCVAGGALLAPVLASAIVVDPRLGWRWTQWIQVIVTFTAALFAAFFLPETYGPVILKRKAKSLRKAMGDEKFWHPQEQEKISPRNVLTKYLGRPLRMLLTEPMVTCMSMYASFVYGLLFFQLQSFAIVFREQRKWGLVTSTLPFLGLLVGICFAVPINFAYQPYYARAVAKNNGQPVPEARLPPLLLGGVFFSGGLFWFGWTAGPEHPWPLPVVAAGFIGAGFTVVLQQALNYLADTYRRFAASAMAANTFLRSLLACSLPLAARPMFLNLGVGPACSLLGGLSCLALPVPLLFMKYGARLREMSKFAPGDKA